MMSQVMMHGKPVQLSGHVPQVGMKAPNFRLLDKDLKERTLDEFNGKRKLMMVLQSVDMPVCAKIMRHFNDRCSKLDNTVMLCITSDTPFALNRFCEAHGCMHSMGLSMMRDCNFCKDYGLLMMDGPLKGMCAHALFVLDEHNNIIHQQLLPEAQAEPNYEEACRACMGKGK